MISIIFVSCIFLSFAFHLLALITTFLQSLVQHSFLHVFWYSDEQRKCLFHRCIIFLLRDPGSQFTLPSSKEHPAQNPSAIPAINIAAIQLESSERSVQIASHRCKSKAILQPRGPSI
ncbi:unnamed protein product [Rhizophagus irregularis]|nr:unnamed protein product [Rhizophagus irregularis]